MVATGVLALGCATHASANSTSSSAPRGSVPAPSNVVLETERRTLVFEPSRSDFTVGRAVFTVAVENPAAIRLSGAGDLPRAPWVYIELARISDNYFELPRLRVERVAGADPGILCASVKVWFAEVPNELDGLYYADLDDRYALVAWCSRDPESVAERAYRSRFSQNRVATIEQLEQRLSRPFRIELNDRPLQAATERQKLQRETAEPLRHEHSGDVGDLGFVDAGGRVWWQR